MLVQVQAGSHDFKIFLNELKVTVSGLVPNPRAALDCQTQTCHCWRFVRRAESLSFEQSCGSFAFGLEFMRWAGVSNLSFPALM